MDCSTPGFPVHHQLSVIQNMGFGGWHIPSSAQEHWSSESHVTVLHREEWRVYMLKSEEAQKCLCNIGESLQPHWEAHSFHLIVVWSLSHAWPFVTPWTAARQASLSSTISRSLLKLMSLEWVMSSNHLLLCRPLLLSSIFPSIRVISNALSLHIRWPKYWSFSISPSNESSGLTSFRVDWFDLLAVQ